jgi:hypothetical protein
MFYNHTKNFSAIDVEAKTTLSFPSPGLIVEPNPFIFPRGLKKNRKVKNSKGWEKAKNLNRMLS